MIVLFILSAILILGILFSLYCMIKVASEILSIDTAKRISELEDEQEK